MSDYYKLVFTTQAEGFFINLNVDRPNKTLTSSTINEIMDFIVNSGIVVDDNARITGKKSAKLYEYSNTNFAI